MEQLVFGLFQEQLSKIIVGFRKEQVNANLLNGKGEITDVALNCSFINEIVRRISPLVEFEEIHVSRLGFHVTSWANIRKAPIVVDIGKITAVVQEPLQCLPKGQRSGVKILPERELVSLLLQGLYKPIRGTGSYGFADRILDNLTIEIETIRISLQTWGKFKTRRIGPWTPPRLEVEMRNLRAVAVDQHGHEASPDQVWAHNRGGMGHFVLFKKLSAGIDIKVISNENQTVHLIERLNFEVQVAVKRRLRDGATLGIQCDLTIPNFGIDIAASDIPLLAHFAAAIQYCLAKDRSFEDPLKKESMVASPKRAPSNDSIKPAKSDGTGAQLPEAEDEEEVEDDNDDDDDDDDADIEKEHADTISEDSFDNGSNSSNNSTIGEEAETKDGDSSTIKTNVSTGSIDAPVNEKPLLLFPFGLVIYENICFTCSVHNVSIRGLFGAGKEGYVQAQAKGCIGELIWPKAVDDPGLYVQSSVSYMSVQERIDSRSRTILTGGIAHEDHQSLHRPSKKPREVHVDQSFPFFERRSIREDPLDLRHSFPSQAFGAKSTVDILNLNEENEAYMILHEIGVDEFDIVLDAESWCRILKFLLHEDGGGYDPRWHSGDWTDLLTPDMLRDQNGEINLDDHLQEAKQIFLDENFMISSDLFNVTARCTNVAMRIPANVKNNVRSCDILVEVKESTVVVSSALPRTFLSGKIGNAISGDGLKEKAEIDFPNDPSDIAYQLEKAEDPALRLSGIQLSRNISTFRLQVTTRGFQVKTIPVVPFCNSLEPQQLIAPTTMTTIVCFEGEPPTPSSDYMKIAMFISTQVQSFHINIDFDLLAGATSSLLHQATILREAIDHITALMPTQPPTPQASSKVKKSLKGRRIMVRRHISQSRETGGLGIVFAIQVSQCGFAIWRQNVPFISPFRDDSINPSTQNGHISVLKLVDAQLKEVEMGVEFDFHADHSRRTVFKCCLEGGRVQLCAVKQEMNRDCTKAKGGSSHDGFKMVDLVTFGEEKLPGNLNSSYSGHNKQMALRLEEQLNKGTRSWSLAADFDCPTTVNACVEEIKDNLILLIEALLMPTWLEHHFEAPPGAQFPSKTIGAMFTNLLSPGTSPGDSLDISWEDLPKGATDSADPMVERLLRAACNALLPFDLHLVLLRLEVANLLLSIPNETKNESRRLGMHLMQSDLVVRFFPEGETQPTEMADILACKGEAWSSLIRTEENGYYQSIRSRQSLLSLSESEEGVQIDELVHPFNIGLTYAAAGVHLAMDEDLRVKDVRQIESFLDGMQELQDRSLAYTTQIVEFLRAIRQPATFEESTALDSNPVVGANILESDSSDAVPHKDTDVAATLEGCYEVARARKMLQGVHADLGDYVRDLRRALDHKEGEIECLKRAVFTKEKERFAALALSSSSVAGWMRVGGVHRTGQRVARKSTLWPYWTVLRKNLLIMYASPSEPKPLDVVLLTGARIRQLAGDSNRQDTKRGFAIIESAGITRYFVAATAREYSLWVREIIEVIDACSDGTENSRTSGDFAMDDETISGLRGIGIDSADISGHPSESSGGFQDDEGQGPGRVRRLGNRLAGARNRLGGALEKARQKGKEISERRKDGLSKGEISDDLCSDGPSSDRNAILSGAASEEKLDSSVRIQDGRSLQHSAVDGATSIEPRENDSMPRRMQFGKAFTGMGQATKSRLGSAIQNARQKGAEVSGRISSNNVESANRTTSGFRGKLQVLANGPRSNVEGGEKTRQSDILDASVVPSDITEVPTWVCSACTFVNKSSNPSPLEQICEMCGTPSPPPSMPVPHKEDQLTPSIQNTVDIDSPEISTGTEAGQLPQESKRGRFAALGAAVRGVAQNAEDVDSRQNGARFNFRMRGTSATNDSSFEDSSITVRRARASGQAPRAAAAPLPPISLKYLEGKWMVSVKPHFEVGSSQIEELAGVAEGESDRSASPLPADLNNTKPEKKMDSQELGMALMDNEEIAGSTDRPSHSSFERTKKHIGSCSYTITSQRVDDSGERKAVEKKCSLGDLLQLHSMVSECVVSMMPTLHREKLSQEAQEQFTNQGENDRSNLVENVLVSGRTLSGFLDLDEGSDIITKTMYYQAEIIELFLNAVLQCPLPVEPLVEISRLLGISSATRDESLPGDQIEPNGTKSIGEDSVVYEDSQGVQISQNNERLHRESEPFLSRSEKIFGVLSACETELMRVEVMPARTVTKQEAATIAESASRHDTNTVNSSVYNPLLPPSVSRQIQEAMHEALMKIMSERDEAQAQLMASNVLHVHELEQERRKNERLRIEKEIQVELARVQQPNVGNFFQNLNDDRERRQLRARLQAIEQLLMRSNDTEITEMCRQLAGEISAKTNNALEIVRLKESREIEQNNESAEKKAMENELRRVKKLLEEEKEKAKKAAVELEEWKAKYEKSSKT